MKWKKFELEKIWSWRYLKLKKLEDEVWSYSLRLDIFEIQEVWSWRNLKLKKFEVEEIWSWRKLDLKKFEVENWNWDLGWQSGSELLICKLGWILIV